MLRCEAVWLQTLIYDKSLYFKHTMNSCDLQSKLNMLVWFGRGIDNDFKKNSVSFRAG